MQATKDKKQKIMVMLIICLVCILAVVIPWFMFAEDGDSEFVWEWANHDFKGNHCTPNRTDHIIITQENSQSTVDFYGHYSNPYFEYALTSPGDPSVIQNEFFNFTLNTTEQYPHSCIGSGFLFNVNQEDNTGYYIMMDSGSTVYLMYLNGFVDPSEYDAGLYQIIPMSWPCHPGYIGYKGPWSPGPTTWSHSHGGTSNGEYVTGGTEVGTFTASYTGPHELIQTGVQSPSTLHNISIQATSNHLIYIDNDQVILDVDLPYDTGGCDFGPAVQWEYHRCKEESHIQFKNVLCGVNKYPPTADFNYNLKIASTKQPLFVTATAKDRNIPASDLTYLWTVERIEPSGARTKVYDSSATPPSYNQWGPGTYETTLRVKNEYYLFSETVTKRAEIIATPSINIFPDKSKYYAGDSVTFKCDGWYNCANVAGDVLIENTVSNNLYEPAVFLTGSNGISKVSGAISAGVVFSYADGTTSSKVISVPPEGIVASDINNKDKEVNKIAITYKYLPAEAEISSNSPILYTYKTSSLLSDYYVGGVNPRRYEMGNVVTCTIQISTGPVLANASATTSLIEKTVSFSLSGKVDNNGAVTSPPKCNTEFLFTGTSIGGETISQYLVVTNGKSSSITVPYGNYTLSEEAAFALGYDDIAPMSVRIDDDGITVGENTVIENNGEVPFTKVLQVSTVNIQRELELPSGVIPNNAATYKAYLVGTPVINEIKASFGVVSSGDNPAYYWNEKSDLVLPIGTYMIKETLSDEFLSLEDITVREDVLWDRVLNAKAVKENGKASFAAKKNEKIPIVFKYASDERVYDEDDYDDISLILSVKLENFENSEISQSDIDKVIVNPTSSKYPVAIRNVDTDEEYCAIIDGNSSKMFKYLCPGRYEIICSNNMYMDLGELRKINSNGLKFSKVGSKYYVDIPDASVDGEYQELSRLTNWRGYSSLSTSISPMEPDVYTHVSFDAKASDQDGKPVSGVTFSFYDEDGNILHLKQKSSKWYPSKENEAGAVSSFKTDKNGEFHIYKFPKGKYTIKETSPSDLLYAVTPEQVLVVDGSRNIGIDMKFSNIEKIEAPSSIELAALKKSIDIGESLQIATSIAPSAAFKNVSFVSDDVAIADVSEDGTVIGNKAGTTIIKAISSADSSIIGEFEITVYDSTNPKMANLKQTISSIRLEVGETYNALTTFTPATVKSPAITWASSNSSVASVSSNGAITGNGVGTTDIIAKCDDLTAVCRVTVGKTLIPVREISFVEDSVTIICNDDKLSKGRVEVVVSPADASDPTVTFTSSDPDIVSVDADGNLTAKTPGTVTITATASNGTSQSCVISSVPIIDKISLNVDSFSIIKGNTAKIIAQVSPRGACNENSLKWTSADPSTASVDDNGMITANKVGKTTILLTASYPGAKDVVAECRVNVVTDEVMATDLQFSLPQADEAEALLITEETEIKLAIGGETEFIAEVMPSTTTNPEIEWSYSRTNVVTIGPADPDTYSPNSAYNTYKILAYGDSGGETTVTGRVKGTNITASFKVVVDAPGTGVSLTKQGSQTLVLGIDPSFNIGVEFDNVLSTTKNINWSLSDESKATLDISNNKKEVTVTALEAGTVTLTVEAEFRVGGKFSDSIEITIEEPRIDILVNDTNISAMNLNKGGSQIFVFQPNCSKESYGPLACTFDDYDKHIISINSVPEYNTAKGWAFEVVGLTPGTTTIAVNPTSSLFGPIYITVTVSGEESRVDTYFNGIVGNNITIDSGSTETIILKANCPNEGYEISINDATIINGEFALDESTLDGIITVTGLSAGTATITVTPKYAEIVPFDITVTVT